MSSVKRRKVDGDAPSGILRKKNVVKEPAPASTSTSPGPTVPEDEEEEAAAEPTKSFKDLVRTLDTKLLLGTKLTEVRASSIPYATLVRLWDIKLQLQFKPNRYPSHSKVET